MIPLSDGIPARRFPFVNTAIVVACFAVWLLYEVPNLQSAVNHSSFYPCTVNATCHHSLPWGVSWITAMFMHGSWDHILGNMIFLIVFGKNVEDAFGHVPYLLFYFAGGLAATMTQTAVTLIAGQGTNVPNLGASGAIAAVLGAYAFLYPTTKVLGLVVVFPVRVPAWIYLGLWFLYQLVEGNLGLTSAKANGGGVAFFAHIGGFVFGYLVALAVVRAGKVVTPDTAGIESAV